MDTSISLRELLEAGCHFGHQSQRWNPKASTFIYTKRDGVHIIDLVKTRDALTAAGEHISKIIAHGGKIIFLGTKRQAKEIIKEEAKRCNAFYVSEHWPAGLLTNYDVIKKNLLKMKDLKEKLVSEEKKAGFTKKEVGLWEKELIKLELFYGGIAELLTMPELLFVVDVKKEAGAVKEARKRGVSVVGIVDTNSDPTSVDFAIPANDDALGSIKIITKFITDAVIEGARLGEKIKLENEKLQKTPVKVEVPEVKKEAEPIKPEQPKAEKEEKKTKSEKKKVIKEKKDEKSDKKN